MSSHTSRDTDRGDRRTGCPPHHDGEKAGKFFAEPAARLRDDSRLPTPHVVELRWLHAPDPAGRQRYGIDADGAGGLGPLRPTEVALSGLPLEAANHFAIANRLEHFFGFLARHRVLGCRVQVARFGVMLRWIGIVLL